MGNKIIDTEIIHIAFAINNNYIDQLKIVLYSLSINNQDEYFNIYILNSSISNENKDKIKKLMYKNKKIKIKFIEINDRVFKEFRLNIDHITVETYYRYLLSEVIPDKIKKVIYLDADTLIIGKIKGLWNTNLNNNYVAGVQDVFIQDIDYKKQIGFNDEDIYVNAGVLVFNLDKIRNDKKTQEMISNTLKYVDTIKYQDQDIINITFKDKIKEVDSSYNYTSREFVNNPSKASQVKIIHFTGSDKPWKTQNEANRPYTHYLYDKYVDLSHNLTGSHEITDLQKVILDIYKEFQRICEKNGLRYYANGGTKIGAVRHSGFIPWDDDIDIDMPINDYEKFIEIAENNLKDKYEIKQMFGGITSTIVNKKTMYTEYFYLGYPEKYTGVFIDIHPVFGTPNNESDRNHFVDRMNLLANNIIFNSISGLYSDDETSRRDEFKEYKKLSTMYNIDKSDYTLTILGQIKKKGLFKTEHFLNSWNMKFEDTTINVPIGFDSELKKQYGDYSLASAPKNELERSIHMSRSIIDLKTPYKEYAEKMVDSDAVRISKYLTSHIASGWLNISMKELEIENLKESLNSRKYGIKQSFRLLMKAIKNRFLR